MRTVLRSALLAYARPIVAVAVTALLGLLARPPVLADTERAEMAAHFSFARTALPEPSQIPLRTVRAVHPGLDTISAWISSVGAAVALHDLDGDGLPNDLCYVDPRIDRAIVAPVPGTGPRFAPFALDASGPSAADPASAPMGCLATDLNEDGRIDLLLYFWGRAPLALIRQEGPLVAATFSGVEIILGGADWYTNAATTADVDGDGHADLVLGNYFADGSRVLDAEADPTTPTPTMQTSMSRADNGGGLRILLWRPALPGSQPSVRFEEAVGAVDPAIARGWTLALATTDLDGDLLPEIYVANDFGPDRLLHNRSTPGAPRFALLEGRRDLTTPRSKVLGHDSFKGMGVDVGDLNGDGLLDLFVSNIAAEYALEESHFAFLATGDQSQMWQGVAPFVDRSETLGLARSSWAWDARFGDFDNDGVLEIVQATGFMRGTANRWPELHELAMSNDWLVHDPRAWHRFRPGDDLSGHGHSAFFVRSGHVRYVDLAADVGLGEAQVSRGIATADVDGDGRLDLAIANQWEPSAFYHNESREPGAFLGLHVLLPVAGAGPAPLTWRTGHPGPDLAGRPAIGAAISALLPDGRRLVGHIDGGNGHSGKRSPDLHLGLGQIPPDAPIQVEVRWRDETGAVRERQLVLTPGWHTLRLSRDPDEAR